MGGKGQDVGVAMSCLMSEEEQSRDDKVLLAQFLGLGPEGDAVSGTLRTKRTSIVVCTLLPIYLFF